MSTDRMDEMAALYDKMTSNDPYRRQYEYLKDNDVRVGVDPHASIIVTPHRLDRSDLVKFRPLGKLEIK